MAIRSLERGDLFRCALVLSFLLVLPCALSGCGRKPAPRAAPEVVVEVAKDGTVTAGGEKLASERLLAFLKEEADRSGRDEEGLPVVGVVISADPECAYRYVQDVMVQSMRAYIAGISWEMGGRRLDAHLPTDPDTEHPVYIYEETEPPKVEVEQLGSIDPSEFEAETLYKATVDRPGPAAGDGDGAADPSESEDKGPAAGPVVVLREGQALPELRVKIYWANAKGQVIHSPERAFPIEWRRVRVPLSTEGARVAITINQYQCADLKELERKLGELALSDPRAYVVIDARRMVPFRWAFEALEACRKAKVRSVRFQAPPVGQGGSDWWWQ